MVLDILSIINLCKEGHAIFGNLKRFKKSKTPLAIDSPEAVAERFVNLFEAHGVHRNQILQFFDKNLTLKSLSSSHALSEVLTEDMLEKACSIFNVRREWLDGVDGYIYETLNFYKNPQKFENFLIKLIDDSGVGSLGGILVTPNNPDITEYPVSMLVIAQKIKNIGNKEIYRHYICDFWPHTYWKSRVYLTACIAIAWKYNICIFGKEIDGSRIHLYQDEEIFLPKNIYEFDGCQQYCEDMALFPEKLLEEVDPEKNNFGHISAIELWLKLSHEGYMDIGMYQQSEVRKRFVEYLEGIKKQSSIESYS